MIIPQIRARRLEAAGDDGTKNLVPIRPIACTSAILDVGEAIIRLMWSWSAQQGAVDFAKSLLGVWNGFKPYIPLMTFLVGQVCSQNSTQGLCWNWCSYNKIFQ